MHNRQNNQQSPDRLSRNQHNQRTGNKFEFNFLTTRPNSSIYAPLPVVSK